LKEEKKKEKEEKRSLREKGRKRNKYGRNSKGGNDRNRSHGKRDWLSDPYLLQKKPPLSPSPPGLCPPLPSRPSPLPLSVQLPRRARASLCSNPSSDLPSFFHRSFPLLHPSAASPCPPVKSPFPAFFLSLHLPPLPS